MTKYKAQVTKIFSIILMGTLLNLSLQTPVYAQATVQTICSGDLDVPDPRQLVCPLIALVNFLAVASGFVFVLMGLWTAAKFAMAQGEPKAKQGARQTAWWTIVGFIGFLFLGTIFVLINNVFGLNSELLESPLNPFNKLIEGIESFFTETEIINFNP